MNKSDLALLLYEKYARELPEICIESDMDLTGKENNIPVTNVIELILKKVSREKLVNAMRLSGANERTVSGCASDYEVFRELCRLAPRLAESDVYRDVKDALAADLGFVGKPCEKNCDKVWHLAAEKLSKAPQNDAEKKIDADIFISDVTEFVNINDDFISFCHSNSVQNIGELKLSVQKFVDSKKSAIAICFDENFKFVKPNEYTAGKELCTLLSGEPSVSVDVLACEALRFVAECCKNQGVKLGIALSCSETEPLKALEYLRSEDLLPQLFLVVTSSVTNIMPLVSENYAKEIVLVTGGGYSNLVHALKELSKHAALSALVGVSSVGCVTFRRAVCEVVADNFDGRSLADAAKLVIDICYNIPHRFWHLKNT